MSIHAQVWPPSNAMITTDYDTTCYPAYPLRRALGVHVAAVARQQRRYSGFDSRNMRRVQIVSIRTNEMKNSVNSKPGAITRRSLLRSAATLSAGALLFPDVVPASALGRGRTAPSNRVVLAH